MIIRLDYHWVRQANLLAVSNAVKLRVLLAKDCSYQKERIKCVALLAMSEISLLLAC